MYYITLLLKMKRIKIIAMLIIIIFMITILKRSKIILQDHLILYFTFKMNSPCRKVGRLSIGQVLVILLSQSSVLKV